MAALSRVPRPRSAGERGPLPAGSPMMVAPAGITLPAGSGQMRGATPGLQSSRTAALGPGI